MKRVTNGPSLVVAKGAKNYEGQLKAINLALLLIKGEEDIAAGHTRPARAFLEAFSQAHGIPRRKRSVKIEEELP